MLLSKEIFGAVTRYSHLAPSFPLNFFPYSLFHSLFFIPLFVFLHCFFQARSVSLLKNANLSSAKRKQRGIFVELLVHELDESLFVNHVWLYFLCFICRTDSIDPLNVYHVRPNLLI